MFSTREDEEFADENIQYQQKASQQYAFTFQNNDSKDYSMSFQGGSSQYNMNTSNKFSIPINLSNAEKEEKLERIRQMESRMKQLQQEKIQLDFVVNDSGEKAQLISENSQLKNQLSHMETALKQLKKEEESVDKHNEQDRERQLAFETKVNQLVKENTSLIEQFKSAKQDLDILIKQKELDNANCQFLQEKLLAVERMNEKLEDKNRMLRDEINKIQYHSGEDEAHVKELKNQYKRVNDLLDLELKNKKHYEMQLISAKQAQERLKLIEMEYTSLQSTLDKSKKHISELVTENNTLKEQYYSENQKNVMLEKTSLKLYQLQKDLEISQQCIKDNQIQLQSSQKSIHERDYQLQQQAGKLSDLNNQLELRLVDEKKVKEQMRRESEIKVEQASKIIELESQKAEQDNTIRQLRKDLESQNDRIKEQNEKYGDEQSKNKDLRQKEQQQGKDIDQLSEQLQNLQNLHDKLQEKYARSQKQSAKELEESQMIIDEIKTQNEGEFIQLTKKCQRLESGTEELESTLNITRSELEECKKKFSNFKAKYEDEHIKGAELQAKLDDREEMIDQLNEQIESCKQKEQKLSEQYARMQEFTKNFTQEKENQLREMQKVSDMKRKLAERQMEQKDKEMQQIIEERTYLSEQLDQGQELLREYESQCIQIDANKLQIDSLNETILILERQLVEKNVDLKNHDKVIRELESEREKLSEIMLNYVQALEEAKQTENHVREEKRKYLEQLKSLNHEKRISDEKALLTETIEKQKQELIVKLDENRGETKQIIEESKLDQLQIANLQKELERAYVRQKELEESQSAMKLIQNQKEIEERNLDVEMLKMKNESLLSVNTQYEEEILQQSRDMQELERTIKTLRKQITSLQSDIEEKESDIHNHKRELELVEKQVLLKLSHEKNQYQNQVTDLQLEVEYMKNLKEQIELLKTNDSKYLETIASLQQEINKLELDKQDLQFQGKQLELQLQKSQISLNQNIHFSASSHFIELETQIHQLQAKNSMLESQLQTMTEKYEQKAKLFEKYGVSFDPEHPNYNQTIKKKNPQASFALNSPPFSPRKNLSSVSSNNNSIMQSPTSKKIQNYQTNKIQTSQQISQPLFTSPSRSSLTQDLGMSSLSTRSGQQPLLFSRAPQFNNNNNNNNNPTNGISSNNLRYLGQQIPSQQSQNMAICDGYPKQVYQNAAQYNSIDSNQQNQMRYQDFTRKY